MADKFNAFEVLSEMGEQLPDLPAPQFHRVFDIGLLIGPMQRDDPPDDRFVATVLRFGILNPVWLCYHSQTQTYTVVDGRERVWAARLAALVDSERRYIPALVYADLTPAQEAALTALANRLRSENAITDVMAIRRLRRLELSDDQIRAAAGLHPATLKSFGKYDNLLGEFEEAWLVFGTIDTPTVDLLVRCTEDEQKALLQIYKEQGNILRQVTVKLVLDARPKPPVEVKVNKAAAWQDTAAVLLKQVYNLIPAGEAWNATRGHLNHAMNKIARSTIAA